MIGYIKKTPVFMHSYKPVPFDGFYFLDSAKIIYAWNKRTLLYVGIKHTFWKKNSKSKFSFLLLEIPRFPEE